MVFGVKFVSPTWCYAGLPDTTDFSITTNTSPSGYPSSDGFQRLYSRQACENLGEGDGTANINVYHANGECHPVLAPDGNRYDASVVCAGLNDNTVNDLVLPITELDYICPERDVDDLASYNFFVIIALGIIVLVLIGVIVLQSVKI